MKKLIQALLGFCLAAYFQPLLLAQTITSQPTNLTINIASSATFTVVATGATNYQWQFDGTNLTDVGNITGSATAALSIDDVSTNQAGTYSVVIDGTTTSSNAVLTLVPGTLARFIFTNFNGSTNFIDVELFNHDKPVTVQNFLHYINGGAYTNTFMDRLVPNFVLQGGDYGTTDQTNTNPPPTGWTINQQFTTNVSSQPAYPAAITNEFGVGPLIHNRLGTIAMAKVGGNPNSASSAFFVNLADNSTNLDNQNGGFTVFGRMLPAGTNVLNYFNAWSASNGIVVLPDIVNSGLAASNLPVNYNNTNTPANANLIFCSFQLTSPPTATNPPSVVITSPTDGLILSNGYPLTVHGTAADNNNIGLASVRCELVPQMAADGTYPNGGVGITNYLLGATNWSVTFSNVPPGTYSVSAQVLDEASNSSEVFVQPVIVSPVFTSGTGAVTFSYGTNNNLNAVGYPFQNGSNYNLVATAGANHVFANWSSGGRIVGLLPQLDLLMGSNVLVTATFITNSLTNSIAFTYPLPNAVLGEYPFTIIGTITNVPSYPVYIDAQIVSTSNYIGSVVITNTGATNWTVRLQNALAAGSYVVEVTLTDTNGNATAITETFTVEYAAPLHINIVGNGTVSYTNGANVPLGTNFTITATPGSGAAFFSWNDGTQITGNPTLTETMSNGLTLTATFVPSTTNKGITITSPVANARLNTNTFAVKGRILSGFKPTEITCQIFQTNGLAVGAPMTTTSTETSTWSVTASNIPGGIYFVEASASNGAGEGMVATQPFTVLSFAAAQGTYTGLFICTNVPVAATNSGYFQFTVNSVGLFSGKLEFPAFPALPVYNLYFVNIDNTTGYFTNVTSSHVPEAPLGIGIYLDLSGGSETAGGVISGPGWSSLLICHRAVTKLSASTTPAIGKYIFSLQNQSQTNGPYTNGCFALTVAKNGVLSLSGVLPDDTTFSESTRVSGNGQWPLYVVPGGDKNNGVLLGWESFTNLVNSTGELYWYKGSNVGTYYASGVGVRSNMLLTATGTNFLRPTPGSQYSIVFAGGSLTAPLTNTLTASASGQFVVSGGADDKLRINLSANGLLSGSFLDPAANETLRFKGAFIGPGQGGSGFIPGTDGQTGSFALQPAAP